MSNNSRNWIFGRINRIKNGVASKLRKHSRAIGILRLFAYTEKRVM